MGVIKMVEEWKCEFCGAREKMEAEKEIADHILRDPVLGVFGALGCCADFDPDTDWLRHFCQQKHEWYACPKCQESMGDERTGKCPHSGCDEYSLVLDFFRRLKSLIHSDIKSKTEIDD